MAKSWLKLLSVSGKGKGLGIFQSEEYKKDHERIQFGKLFWNMRWAVFVWLACAFAFALAFAAEHLWRYGWSPATLKWISIYFQHMLFSGGLSVIAEIPGWVGRVFLRTDFAVIAPLLPILAYYALSDSTLTTEFNPYGKDAWEETSSRKAEDYDVKKMGLLGGFMMVLGYWKKKPLMLPKTLSTLCVAPPGTGKTQGLVIPTILECDTVSMIINDPKPELKQISSGYRASVGFVFIMNWAGQDDPANGVYYPSWNPLSPVHIPYRTEDRDLYVDSIVNTLIADKASSTADPHWTISGRAALSGLIQFMISKIEKAKANDYFKMRLDTGAFDAEDAALLTEYYSRMNDPNAEAARNMLYSGHLNSMNYVHVGTWSQIPPSWIGKEASLSMILDWLNTNQINMNEEIENRRKQGDQMVMMSDPMRDLLMRAVDEARQYDYSHRAVLELTQLAQTPDKERGSILSTVMAGLGIFRNAAVRNRTSHSDFHFSDMRGIQDPVDGKWKPVTVFLSINQVDAEALNPITAIFIELMSRYLISNAPNSQNNGVKLGPTPTLFLLDEMPKMQKMQAIIQGPDVGRSQQVSYMIIGQDLHQIAEKYGNDAAATILTTTAAKVVLRQNDMETARKFSELMGNKIVKKKTKGADGKDIETPETKPLYEPMDILKLDADKELVIYEGFAHRPIEADLQMAYKDERLLSKQKMGESKPLPDHLAAGHHAAMGYPGVAVITEKEKLKANG